ncbi:MAG TPA: hypothetical protein VEY32_00840 [Flavisolibacter sp.]|jgi:hypothetical protein|nr:hypothetical protein [Flavisolibacter sp.]
MVPTEQLQMSSETPLRFHPFVHAAARVVSVIFHPLFIPVYISWFLLYHTSLFAGFRSGDRLLLLIRFLVMYSVFPLVTILLAKGLGFVKSIYLRDQKDRIIPYIACGLYYFWMWYVLRNQPEFPKHLVMLSLAIFLASSCGLVLNGFIKVSMHGLSVGVMIAFIYLMAFLSVDSFGIYISVALFVTGLVCTARLINSDHHPVEVYLGLILGILSQLLAYWFTF